ncbi:MAG TPA: valine--pyruvate transaminase [Lacipirellulaceae bacterium]|nr:valine--pyruvate transaminase [Lacipirellulaceae bacterium]
MAFSYSSIGEKLSRHSGIVELMDDLGQALSEAQAGSAPVAMMGGGAPAHIPAVQEAWRRRLAEIVAEPAQCDRMLTTYDPPLGNARFRESVARSLSDLCGWRLAAENVAVTCGGQSAFFYLFNLLAGDAPGGPRRVLLPIMPEYIGYADQGLMEEMFVGLRPRIEMTGPHGFKYHVDFEAVDRALRDRALGIAAICVSRPTNPSGNVLSDAELDGLASRARQQGIPLIVDNAYGLPFPGAVFEPIAPLWDPNVILTFSLSKVGLPGVRTGFIVAEPEIIRRIGSLTGIIGLANTNVGQAIVRPMLDSSELLQLSRDVICPYYRDKARLAESLVREAFGDSFPFALHRSEGAFFLWLWLPELPIATRELYRRLKARGVLIVPGEYFFYGLPAAEPWPHAAQCLRLTFSQPAEVIERGVAAMAEELRRLHGR